MIFQGFEWLWLFFVYSALGWILETVVAAVKQKRFVNRGLINGPFCVLYGIASLLITAGGQEVGFFWLFIGSGIYATAVEWIAGHLIERIYHERWWDYSDVKWNFDGYVCLPVSVFWGFLGLIGVKWGNPLFLNVYHLMPSVVGEVLILVLIGILAVDIAATLIISSGKSKRIEMWRAADSYFNSISDRLGRWIILHVDRRLDRAYPARKKSQEKVIKQDVFAYGCSFYKIVLLFFIAAFLGDITETVFCRVTAGIWMSRSSVVWGPFSIVWGLAIAGGTAMLYKYKDSSAVFLFCMGTCLGGAYEYLCSVFTEMVFGTIFWDYSHLPFNLGGRINLLFCFFWGFAAVLWFKKIYPFVSALIEKIPDRPGKIITWILIVFMICNIVVSQVALLRYNQRNQGIAPVSEWQMSMDEHFDDERMEHIYPNAKPAK